MRPGQPEGGCEMSWPCSGCKNECPRHFAADMINEFRQEVWGHGLEPAVARQMIWSAHETKFLLPSGKKCCVSFLVEACACSNKFLYPATRYVVCCHTTFPSLLTPSPLHICTLVFSSSKVLTNSTRSRADVSIMAWFQDLMLMADKMPDTDWYQLSAPDKKTVFGWYLDDCELYPSVFVPCQYPWFIKCWLKHFLKQIRLRKHCRFSKCTECIQLKLVKDDRKLRMQTRQEAHTGLDKHYRYIKRERTLQLKRAWDAIKDPTKVLTICQDATNQLPFGFPNYVEIDKTLFNHSRIKTHLMIDIVHGHGCYVHAYPDTRVLKNPNCTIECLTRTLLKVEAEKGFLPDILNLQMDNCARENKNSYVVAYLAWLLERFVFKFVYLSFLPVGHTHNEADQCASCLGIACRCNDVTCLGDLMNLVAKSFFPRPQVEWLPEVAHWQKMMNPPLDPAYGGGSHIKAARNIMGILHFRLSLSASGVAVVQTKDTVRMSVCVWLFVYVCY